MTLIVASPSFTAWPALVSELSSLVPECPQPLMKAELIKAARRFFTDSMCWRQSNLTLLTTVANQMAYTFNAPDNAELLEVISCWDGDDELDVGRPGETDDYHPEQSDSEYIITVANGGATLNLTPVPETAGIVLEGSVAYTLSNNAGGIPTWAYDEHKDGIVAGAAARLVMQPKKPWTDREAYRLHMDLFDTAVRDASNKAGPIKRRPLRTKPW